MWKKKGRRLIQEWINFSKSDTEKARKNVVKVGGVSIAIYMGTRKETVIKKVELQQEDLQVKKPKKKKKILGRKRN